MPKPTTLTKPKLDGGTDITDTTQKLKVFATYDPKTKTAVASTGVLDRQDEIIDQKGWDLKNFKKNNPLLWSHNSYEPLIGNCKNIRVEKMQGKDALLFEPDFHEETDLAKAIKALYEQGRLKTFSVGFKPIEMEGNTYTKQELLEISAVNVPANPEAVMLAYRSLSKKGFNGSVIKEVINPSNKGAIQDELDAEAAWEAKFANMEDLWDIFYALCDVYYDPDTSVNDFNDLLAETISLFQQVLDGSYVDPDDAAEPQPGDDIMQTLIYQRVLDNHRNIDKTSRRQVKETFSAPKPPSKELRKRQSATKVIANAADHLLAGEKGGISAEERKRQLKIIKRSAELISIRNKEQLKNG